MKEVEIRFDRILEYFARHPQLLVLLSYLRGVVGYAPTVHHSFSEYENECRLLGLLE